MSEQNPPLDVPQGVIERTAQGPRLIGRSPGFTFALEEAALRAAVLFGKRPPGIRCPDALFAIPAEGTSRIFVVTVRDLPGDATDPPLRFHFLAVERDLYHHLGDPFAIADELGEPRAVAELPDLEWPPHPLPGRRIEQIQEILNRGNGALLLGSTQAVLDESQVVVARELPDRDLVHGVWQMLPDRVRCERWPASYAFSVDLGFHLIVVPTESLPKKLSGWLTEERVKDYPEGRYERSMQLAAMNQDQAELDRLLARKSSRDVLTMAVAMVAFTVVVVILLKFL